MLKFFAYVNRHRKWLNVILATYDDFQKNYENEFKTKLDENVSK